MSSASSDARASRARLPRAVAAARNALEVLRLGQLSPAARQPFAIAAHEAHGRLRRYVLPDGSFPAASCPAVLLVPPLMVTADIYDVSADTSGVGALLERGIAPFVVDFGAPEHEAGGMRRTLDDHVLVVSRMLDVVRGLVGRPVHLAGYSQGGMFCYQVAALRKSEGIASIVTFGSPVDLHRSLPAVHSDAVEMMTRAIGPAVSRVLDRIEGLPGILTSTGFKLLTPAKEIQQRIDFVRKLHDRGALERREARRRFLGGEGFVAWPGPALRAFVEQFILHNRMLSGGFVVDGRAATLADITCPVLAFIGRTDELARPAAVRGLTRAAPEAEVSFVELRAGHFGLVVGSRANRETWPTVARWALHHEGRGPLPDVLAPVAAPRPRDDEPEEAAFDDVVVDVDLLWDTFAAAGTRAWNRVGDMVASASDAALAMRYQVPRLRRLAALRDDDRVSAARSLAARARATPEATFFLWAGRAFSFAEADRRVDAVARGLVHCGVRPGDRVGVWMGSRPSFLTAVTAVSRIGAVAVIAPPEAAAGAVAAAFDELGATRRLADPQRAESLAAAAGGEVLVLGGGGGGPRRFAAPLRDMEVIDVSQLAWPEAIRPDAALARDLAMVLLRPRATDPGRLVGTPITNHRWALSAIGAAGACTLRPQDTVYSCLPLHHPTSLLVAVGAALVAGARLALGAVSPEQLFAPGDDAAARALLADLRRYGATVVFYAGELVQGLLRAPPRPHDRSMPVRLFAGSGMRASTRAEVERRFDAGVIEFYASTSLRLVLAEPSGEKPGALGRPLPGSAAVAVVRFDPETLAPARTEAGWLIRTRPDEPGLLLVEVDGREATARRTAGMPVVESAFVQGDRWAPTGDVVRLDRDGDAWLAGALSTRVALGPDRKPIWAREIEAILSADPDVELAVAVPGNAGGGGEGSGPGRVRAAVVLREGAPVEEVGTRLGRAAEPLSITLDVDVVPGIPMNAGFRCAYPGSSRRAAGHEDRRPAP